MITYDWPTSRAFIPERFDIGVRAPAVASTSPTVGAMSITPNMAPRWVCVLSFPGQSGDLQAEREAWFAKLAAQSSLVTMWHLMRPEPKGTLRGTPQLAATLGKGAKQATITCDSGATLKAGDLIKVGTQTVMVTADAAAVSTQITVDFAQPLRASVNSGTAVEWDRPRLTLLAESPEIFLPYQRGGLGDRFSVSFVEVF